MYEIYVGSVSLSSPGYGGVAVVFVKDDKVVAEFSHGYTRATATGVPLLALLAALKASKKNEALVVKTGSPYVAQAAENYLWHWMDNGFLSKKGLLVAHYRTWKRIGLILSNRDPLVVVQYVPETDAVRQYAEDLAFTAAKEVQQKGDIAGQEAYMEHVAQECHDVHCQCLTAELSLEYAQ